MKQGLITLIACLVMASQAQAQKLGIPRGAKVYVTATKPDIASGAAQRLNEQFGWQIMPTAEQADYTINFYSRYIWTGSAKARAKIMKGNQLMTTTRWRHMMGRHGAPEFHYQEAAVYRLIKKEF